MRIDFVTWAFVGVGVFVGGARTAAAQEPPPPPPLEDVRVTAPPSDDAAQGPAPPPVMTTGAEESAKADTKADDKQKPAPGPSGWIDGSGFMLTSADDNYALRVGLQAGYKFEPIYQGGEWRDRRAFFVLRPIIAGTFLKKWIRFWTSLELNSNPPYLLDSYVELQPVNEFGVRLGQQYTLISRHEQFGPQQILFPEWSPVAEYFWTGRDKGATAWGIVADGLFEYYAGAYGGSPLRQFTTIAGNYVLEGRVVFSPQGAPGSNEFPYITNNDLPFRFSTTLQAYYGKVQLAEENFNPSSFRFEAMKTGDVREQACASADIWLQGKHFAFLAEGYVRRTDPDLTLTDDKYTSVGVWGQIGFLILPETLDLGFRFNWLDPSTDLSTDKFVSGEVQVAYYVSHTQNLVIKLRYGMGKQESPGETALGPVTLFTREGNLYIGTLQLNLAF